MDEVGEQPGTDGGERVTPPVGDTDAAVVHGGARPSSRVPLSRERVLEAAVGLIDDRGLAELSMRRLAGDLGVEAMSLYHYVSGREQLLDGVVEQLVTELVEDDEVVTESTHGWQDFLQRLAHGIRKVALRHPRSFPLIASRPPEAPWLRPPLRSLAWVETFLRVLTGEGFADEDAVAAYRAFSSFLLGHLLLEVASLGADIGPLDVVDDTEPAPGLGRYPLVQRLGPALAVDSSAVEFEESLENLLDRLELLLAG